MRRKRRNEEKKRSNWEQEKEVLGAGTGGIKIWKRRNKE